MSGASRETSVSRRRPYPEMSGASRETSVFRRRPYLLSRGGFSQRALDLARGVPDELRGFPGELFGPLVVRAFGAKLLRDLIEPLGHCLELGHRYVVAPICLAAAPRI